jgi:predicted nuclease with TOPRIM domain
VAPRARAFARLGRLSAAGFRSSREGVAEILQLARHARHLVCEHANMEAMREAWTDDRLDDLNDKVDDGFRAVDKRFDRVDKQFDRVDDRFDRVEERFERMEARLDARFEGQAERFDARFEGLEERFDARFDSLQRTLILFCGAMIAALISVIASQL